MTPLSNNKTSARPSEESTERGTKNKRKCRFRFAKPNEKVPEATAKTPSSVAGMAGRERERESFDTSREEGRMPGTASQRGRRRRRRTGDGEAGGEVGMCVIKIFCQPNVANPIMMIRLIWP